MSVEIIERLKSVNRRIYTLTDILESRYVTRRTKKYQTMIRPVVAQPGLLRCEMRNSFEDSREKC